MLSNKNRRVSDDRRSSRKTIRISKISAAPKRQRVQRGLPRWQTSSINDTSARANTRVERPPGNQHAGQRQAFRRQLNDCQSAGGAGSGRRPSGWCCMGNLTSASFACVIVPPGRARGVMCVVGCRLARQYVNIGEVSAPTRSEVTDGSASA